MTYFCEQEALNMKQNMQGFWLRVFTSYGNAFSSHIKARQASGAPLLKDCSVIITVFNGEGHLEEKTLLFFLCFVTVLTAALPRLSMEHAHALLVPSFHYVPRQSFNFFL